MGECPCESVTHCHYAQRLSVRLDIEYRFNFHALHPVKICRNGHELDKEVHAAHPDSHYSDKSGDMLYIIMIHSRLLCVDYQQAGEEAELLGAVALAITLALFDRILD